MAVDEDIQDVAELPVPHFASYDYREATFMTFFSPGYSQLSQSPDTSHDSEETWATFTPPFTPDGPLESVGSVGRSASDSTNIFWATTTPDENEQPSHSPEEESGRKKR